MQVFTFFLKVGVHWTFPRDCIVGISQARPPGESWEGFRVGSCHLHFTSVSSPMN